MKKAAFFSGVFGLTFSTLMLEIIETRLLSVQSWYHLAFFIVSIAMFGLTAGAIWVYYRRTTFTESSFFSDLRRYTFRFSVAIVGALLLKMVLWLSTSFSLLAVASWLLYSLALSVPFFMAGVVTCLVLTRSPYPIGWVYAMDLVGAAVGCLGVLVLLNTVDGPSAVIVVAACAAASAAAFGLCEAFENDHGSRKTLVGPILAVVVLGAMAAVNTNLKHGIQPTYIKGRKQIRDDTLLYERWNSFSRVAAFSTSLKQPFLWGPSPLYDQEWDLTVPTIGTSIDGLAGTATYDFSDDLRNADFLRYDVVNLGFILPGRNNVAVIGVGGGRDMLSAKVFGASRVIGFEINPIFIDLLTEREPFVSFAGLRDLDGVTFVVDEARSALAGSRDTFDLIQMSLTDTWAATGAGAFTLSENGLYTIEAWQIFLDRLSEAGVLSVSRWFADGEVNETGRMVSLAVAALLRQGTKRPSQHIYLVSSKSVATMLVSRCPFADNDLALLDHAVDRYRFSSIATPTQSPSGDLVARILSARNRLELDAAVSGQDLDLTPPTDNSPFFFNQLRWNRPLLLFRLLTSDRPKGVVTGNTEAASTVLSVLVVSCLLCASTLLIPMRHASRNSDRSLLVGGTAYFALIGAGFMIVEIGLLQRMSVFLGHPVYSLSVVLFSLILAAGAGSGLSERIPLSSVRRFGIWATSTAGLILIFPFVLPLLFSGFESAEVWRKAALCVVVIAPLGIALGYAFPSGMRMVSELDQGPTPWFWGINGATGVLASTLAVAISLSFGINTTLIVGGLCYLATIPAVWIFFRTVVDRPVHRKPHEKVV